MSSLSFLPAAVRCSAALLLLASLCGCGPQRVPYPSGPRPGSAGQAATAGSAGQLAPGGSAGVRAAGSGGRANDVAADGGRVSPPPQAGVGAAGTSGVTPFDAGDDPQRNQVQPGMLCARLATIQCAGEAHCCEAPGRDVERCEADQRALCNEQLYLDQIAGNPITGFDAAAAAAAYSELEQRSADCDSGIAAWALIALRGMLKGTLAANQSCKPPGAAAVTDRQAQAAALASCRDFEQRACLPMSLLGDWTCAAKSASGGNCATEDNCQPNMFCRNPNMQIGRCMPRLALAAACSEGSECESLYCKAGRCVAADQQVAFCLRE